MKTISSEHGYSMMEVLISSALGAVVLAGAFDVYVSSTKSLNGQTNSVQMQADTKAALNYMIRELRMAQTAYSTPIIAPSGDTITFTKTEDAGFSSGGNTATTLLDANKSWAVNKFAPTSAAGSYFVWIKSGTGASAPAIAYPILSNTATALTLAGTGWPLPYPDNTSLYFIVRTKAFTLLTDKTLRYSINGGAYQLLAQNVTGLMFSLTNPCNSTTVCVNVTLTARSKDLDPITKTYRTYTITDTARPRNH